MVMCGKVTESCTACFFSFSASSSVSTHFLRSASESAMGPRVSGMRILSVDLGLGRGRGALQEESAFPKRERSEEHTSELQSPCNLVCRLLLEKKKI